MGRVYRTRTCTLPDQETGTRCLAGADSHSQKGDSATERSKLLPLLNHQCTQNISRASASEALGNTIFHRSLLNIRLCHGPVEFGS